MPPSKRLIRLKAVIKINANRTGNVRWIKKIKIFTQHLNARQGRPLGPDAVLATLDNLLRHHAVQIHLKVDVHNRRPSVVPTHAATPRRTHHRQENFFEDFR